MSTSFLTCPAVVLDTSVLIKWFRQEEVWAEQALALRDAYLEGLVLVSIPWLAVYELANVLRYKGDLTTVQVQEAVQSLLEMELEWVSPSSETMRRTVEIARTYETTIYDATFVALAEGLSAAFITGDDRLVRRLALSFVRFLGELEAG
jgi:predicted nucleic acid-binding protein